jgi:hypothetical protein
MWSRKIHLPTIYQRLFNRGENLISCTLPNENCNFRVKSSKMAAIADATHKMISLILGNEILDFCVLSHDS